MTVSRIAFRWSSGLRDQTSVKTAGEVKGEGKLLKRYNKHYSLPMTKENKRSNKKVKVILCIN